MSDLIDNWRDELLMNIQNDVKWKDWSKTFSSAETNKERFTAVYNLPFIDKVIRIEEMSIGKSASDSTEFRNKGNAEYVKKNYREAFSFYTRSIQKAPGIGDMLALGYANRSAVYFDMQKYHLCLKDIDLALKNDYPKKLMHKLLERQGRSKYEIGLNEEAIKYFEEAIKSLVDSNLEKDRQMERQAKLENFIKDCHNKSKAKVKAEECNAFMNPLPSIEGERSSQFPCASDAICMKYSKSKGRYISATRDINVGEVLAIEKPYSSVINDDHHSSHCHHCCKRAEHPIPCSSCAEVVYCNTICREESWNQYHSVECSILLSIKLLEYDVYHLALRMVIKANYDYIKNFEESFADEKSTKPSALGFNKLGQYDSEDYWSIYNLVNHSEERTFSDLFRRTLTAVYLLKCLERTKFFSKADDCKDIHLIVGGHILRHLQMLPCNAHEITELSINLKQPLKSSAVDIGSAVYATLSLFNHSCDPNVVRHSYGNLCVVRAIHHIPKGMDVIDSYGILYPVDDKEKREAELGRRYFFDCSCVACVNDWPLYDDIPSHSPYFKCEKCYQVLGQFENEDQDFNCRNCGERQVLSYRVKELMIIEPKFDSIFNDVLSGDYSDETFSFLLKHLSLLESWICRPWQDLNNCQEALKQIYSTKANHYICVDKQ
ncbi:SET and MYND domain-containing protein 4 [Octopus bimaculoides]|uniref:Protein-lysine N-methyltransferase SMYD4 n=1 Tax=Octopus bimaculoides TaxID=37653 RepID=A0A0L8FYW9_OCTBM|nr:SET and MYND domain-containing protein 4 [Octopus bimaculoides]|eukprot:XP_014785626.1 PREDICTED: SET and MYND domain-containing protein 4-like [Octopus bimaculoides]